MTLQTTETKLNKKKRRKKYIQWIYLTLLLEEPITAEDIAWDENDVCRYERMCAHVHTRSHVHAVNFFQTQVLFLFPSLPLSHTHTSMHHRYRHTFRNPVGNSGHKQKSCNKKKTCFYTLYGQHTTVQTEHLYSITPVSKPHFSLLPHFNSYF